MKERIRSKQTCLWLFFSVVDILYNLSQQEQFSQYKQTLDESADTYKKYCQLRLDNVYDNLALVSTELECRNQWKP